MRSPGPRSIKTLSIGKALPQQLSDKLPQPGGILDQLCDTPDDVLREPYRLRGYVGKFPMSAQYRLARALLLLLGHTGLRREEVAHTTRALLELPYWRLSLCQRCARIKTFFGIKSEPETAKYGDSPSEPETVTKSKQLEAIRTMLYTICFVIGLPSEDVRVFKHCSNVISRSHKVVTNSNTCYISILNPTKGFQMTLEELISQREELDRQINAVRKDELSTAIATVKKLIGQFGLTADDCGFKSQKGFTKEKQAAPIKFRGPNGETWAGRGRAPNWISVAESNGASREGFRVAQ